MASSQPMLKLCQNMNISNLLKEKTKIIQKPENSMLNAKINLIIWEKYEFFKFFGLSTG
jgi:hypothetical protein